LEHFDVSPLQRAQETAAPIAAAHNIEITTDERLIEAANILKENHLELAMEFTPSSSMETLMESMEAIMG